VGNQKIDVLAHIFLFGDHLEMMPFFVPERGVPNSLPKSGGVLALRP
jgi:hypothetical protein